MKKGPSVKFRIIKKFDPLEHYDIPIRKKFQKIYSLFPKINSEITINDFYKIHGSILFPSDTCKFNSAKSILSTCFKNAVAPTHPKTLQYIRIHAK